jgi:hypothetical protein
MVAPAPAHFQVAGGDALEPEAAAPRKCNRRLVPRLNVRLEPVQTKLHERFAKDETNGLGHVAVPGELRNRPVAEEAALQLAAHDLADVEETDDGVVHVAMSEIERARVARSPLEVAGVGIERLRHRQPRQVQRAARTHLPDELVRVSRRRRSQRHRPGARHDWANLHKGHGVESSGAF